MEVDWIVNSPNRMITLQMFSNRHGLSGKRLLAQKEQNMDEQPNENICSFPAHPPGQKNGCLLDIQLHINFAFPKPFGNKMPWEQNPPRSIPRLKSHFFSKSDFAANKSEICKMAFQAEK